MFEANRYLLGAALVVSAVVTSDIGQAEVAAAVANPPAAVVSVSPLILSAPDRGTDLQVRVSAPVSGSKLPIILFSHGYGNSMDGYAPLAHFWAAHGFVVIQPTHLDSRRLGLTPDDPRRPSIWRFRVADMKRILDHLEVIEASVPQLRGRVDNSRIAAVGHSFGGQTTSLLLGARVIGQDGRASEDMSDSRIKVGVLIAAGGKGGKDLSALAIERYPYLNANFDRMTIPNLVVAGDQDQSPLTVRGPDWFTDPYFLSPGARCLLTVLGGQHMLGGISGYLVTETTDEDPDRVAAVAQLTWAYLRSALYTGDPTWSDARAALGKSAHPPGRIECK
jgi:pimeloyl-ACP methyl ester carboxylesterase